MPRPKVQFLSFAGCPLERQARTELEKALAEWIVSEAIWGKYFAKSGSKSNA